MRTIGARVGLHNSSLFHHFPAKREIVGAVLGRINDGLLERLAPLADDEPPALDRLVAVLSALSDHYATHRAEARCAMRLLLDPEGLVNERGSRFTTVLWSWLARAQAARVIRPVSVGHAARCLLGMVLMDPVWAAATRQPDRDDGRRRAELAAFVRGALAPST